MQNRILFCVLSLSAAVSPVLGQSVFANSTPVASTAATAVPALIRYNGIDQGGVGKSQTTATFLIFRDEKGGEPLD